ncbi:ThuA domain-containing protein [Flexithrix dorotheae]|uniref:ThuA domain-containing protein n=1 Tax=Flexithrix dorotheae TaxID=70993 RepID=UPI000366C861|nr:ThuA domain-containing protein [Flexithrix dorotheae]
MKFKVFFCLLFCCLSFYLEAHSFKVLIFSKTAGYRHNSIEDGIAAIQKLGSENNFIVEATEDASKFTFDNLINYDAVIFLSTTGDVLNSSQQEAFEKYIQNGGGYVGIHAASDTEYNWPWYGELVGAYFDSHPSIQTATIEVADKIHPSTKNLPEYWQRKDEWYNFKGNPRGKVHVLATLDESTYSGGNMGYDHPISWCHPFDGGRAWYTGGGHTKESFTEKEFLDHLLGGILYASGDIKGDFEAGIDDRFEITVLDNNPVSPMQVAVLPDLSVLYIERAGKVKIRDINSGIINVAGTIDVVSDQEDGLLGVVLDPDFETNNWIYFFYSPEGFSVQNISRFKLKDKELDLSSEQVILTIPVQRELCCHSGGDLEFDGEGNLYISTGDNVNPFESDGFAPIDERAGRSAYDAQGTSGNTNDLRGKILRIHPEADGTYTIPQGNLFADKAQGKSEIYVMGVRNPFRMAVNKTKKELVWGDVGPDAKNDNTNRGPKGYDEFNKTSVGGNFGWPYFIADNKAYKDYDFSSSSSGNYFDPNTPINNSPNNTGATALPPAIPAWLHYPYGFFNERPEFESEGGRTAAAGDYYYFDRNTNKGQGFPQYYDNSLFIMEWARNWIREVRFDGSGNILQINKFLPDLELNSPIDMHFGPEGAMYLVEWGTGFTDANPDARILKISFKGENPKSAPQAKISVSIDNGFAPLSVDFKGDESSDPDEGDQLTYSWDFDGDENEDANTANATYVFEKEGVYIATLTVFDQDSLFSKAQVTITVGNTAPEISIEYPLNGGFYADGDTILYKVTAIDGDEEVNCEEIIVEPSIGHDDHAHGTGAEPGCEGNFVTQSHGDGSDNVFYVLKAAYEDNGGTVNEPIKVEDVHVLQPKLKQAEHAQELFDLKPEASMDFLGGGQNIGFINHNSYLKFTPMNFKGIDFLTVRYGSETNSCNLEVRIDSVDGPVIASGKLSPTGGWQDYDYFNLPVQKTVGTHEVFFIFKNNTNPVGLGNVNWFEFHGKGIATSDPDAGKGLMATYYSNPDFTGDSVQRKEPMISWDWEFKSPISAIPKDNFSVRWTGQVMAQEAQEYTIFLEQANGEASVWIDNTLVIDKDATSGKYNFAQNQAYNLVVEYTHTSGEAAIKLQWEGSQTKNVIHTNYLINNFDGVISGVEDEVLPEYQIYPNPVSDFLYLDQALQNKNYIIRNLAGIRLDAGKVKEKISTQKLIPGIYLLEIEDFRVKLVKF